MSLTSGADDPGRERGGPPDLDSPGRSSKVGLRVRPGRAEACSADGVNRRTYEVSRPSKGQATGILRRPSGRGEAPARAAHAHGKIHVTPGPGIVACLDAGTHCPFGRACSLGGLAPCKALSVLNMSSSPRESGTQPKMIAWRELRTSGRPMSEKPRSTRHPDQAWTGIPVWNRTGRTLVRISPTIETHPPDSSRNVGRCLEHSLPRDGDGFPSHSPAVAIGPPVPEKFG